MEHAVERELHVPETADQVWEALTEPEWLGEGASIELREAGEVRVGERTGIVEEAEPPRRLVFHEVLGVGGNGPVASAGTALALR